MFLFIFLFGLEFAKKLIPVLKSEIYQSKSFVDDEFVNPVVNGIVLKIVAIPTVYRIATNAVLECNAVDCHALACQSLVCRVFVIAVQSTKPVQACGENNRIII